MTEIEPCISRTAIKFDVQESSYPTTQVVLFMRLARVIQTQTTTININGFTCNIAGFITG